LALKVVKLNGEKARVLIRETMWFSKWRERGRGVMRLELLLLISSSVAKCEKIQYIWM
jgi:hypothetical protein